MFVSHVCVLDILVGIVACVSSFAEGKVNEMHVKKLTLSNFDASIDAIDFSLVEFYAPWCGQCKKIVSEYANAATQLADEGVTNAQICKVDCDNEKELCSKYKVKGYPTIIGFHKLKQQTEFEGPRNTKDFVSFTKRLSGPALTNLASKEAITKFTSSDDDLVVVAYTDDEAKIKIITDAAESMRSECQCGKAAVALSPSGNEEINVHPAFESEPIVLTQYKTAEEIIAFVKLESFPLLQRISRDNYESYVKRHLPLVWVFLKEEGLSKNTKLLRNVAANSKGVLSWVYLDADEYRKNAEDMGLTDKFPGIVIDDTSAQKKFLYSGEFEQEALSVWASKVIAGSIEPFIKSEAIPEDNTKPLTIVVGKNFQDIVYNNVTDVLLEIYAPWCGHCTQLAPKYDALAEFFKNEPEIVISKVDGTLNDMQLPLRGFPTLFFWPAGDKKDEPLSYNDERSTKALAEFVINKSTALTKNRKEILKKLLEDDTTTEDITDDDDEDEEKDEL